MALLRHNLALKNVSHLNEHLAEDLRNIITRQRYAEFKEIIKRCTCMIRETQHKINTNSIQAHLTMKDPTNHFQGGAKSTQQIWFSLQEQEQEAPIGYNQNNPSAK